MAHGGKRQGAGRKPSPNRLVGIQAKIDNSTKERLVSDAQFHGISVSKLISNIIDAYYNSQETDGPGEDAIHTWDGSLAVY